jgi:hypothetical protein
LEAEKEARLHNDGAPGGPGLFRLIEKTHDGQVSPVTTSIWVPTSGEATKNMPITIKHGATIPGTEFTSLDPSEAVDLKLSYHGLECCKRLWRLRCNTGLRSHANYSWTMEPSGIRRRAKNFDREFGGSAFGDRGIIVPLILTSVFLVYGGLHLLAWQYNFQTNAEGIMWRTALTVTASSGLLILLAETTNHLDRLQPQSFVLRQVCRIGSDVFLALFLLSIGIEILGRSFLVIESFRALPNSPSSVYEMPRWTAYLPHV